MKQKNSKRTLTTAAMLMVLATAAYAQNNLTAKIPFSFRVAGSDLPAGRYEVAPASGGLHTSGTMTLRNMDTGKSVFISSKAPTTEATKEDRPRLIFQCVGQEGCALATLWSGTGTGLTFATPALTAAQRERRETIYLDRFKEK